MDHMLHFLFLALLTLCFFKTSHLHTTIEHAVLLATINWAATCCMSVYAPQNLTQSHSCTWLAYKLEAVPLKDAQASRSLLFLLEIPCDLCTTSASCISCEVQEQRTMQQYKR